RSIEMLVALLAVSKTGAAYVPVHASIPIRRVEFILKDAQVGVLLTNIETKILDNFELSIIRLTENSKFKMGSFQTPTLKLTQSNLLILSIPPDQQVLQKG
ncbi:AMP-binding protein, partial [Echinicola jeungdonensis]|uniref:AMP-binding protein n=1 Tax=Echinicola jeungdonensis TaxID=709343 RepID=UPI0025B4C606